MVAVQTLRKRKPARIAPKKEFDLWRCVFQCFVATIESERSDLRIRFQVLLPTQEGGCGTPHFACAPIAAQ